VIVNQDGTTHNPVKIEQCSSQPCNAYDLVDTIYPENIPFKVKTTFTNNRVHLSPMASISVTCSNAYEITAVTTPDIA